MSNGVIQATRNLLNWCLMELPNQHIFPNQTQLARLEYFSDQITKFKSVKSDSIQTEHSSILDII